MRFIGKTSESGRKIDWCLCERMNNMIKDSGNRRKFDTGAVRDIQEGKGRCDLLPLDVVGEVMTDTVLMDISNFQNTGHVEYLRNAINSFVFVFFSGYADAFLELSKHFEEGAKKYGIDNWKKGIPEYCYIDSAVRHYLKFLRGDDDEPHDRAFLWNLICLIWTVENKNRKVEVLTYDLSNMR